MDDGVDRVDHRGVEHSLGSASDEGLAVAAVVVDPVSAKDNLRNDRRTDGTKRPKQAYVQVFVGHGRHAKKVHVGRVLIVRSNDGLRFTPVNHVWALRPAEQSPSRW